MYQQELSKMVWLKQILISITGSFLTSTKTNLLIVWARFEKERELKEKTFLKKGTIDIIIRLSLFLVNKKKIHLFHHFNIIFVHLFRFLTTNFTHLFRIFRAFFVHLFLFGLYNRILWKTSLQGSTHRFFIRKRRDIYNTLNICHIFKYLMCKFDRV